MTTAKLKLKTVQKTAYRLVLLPMGMTGLLSLLLGLAKGFLASSSAFWGGTIWTLPSFMLAYFLFKNTSPRAARRILITLYITEIIKLGLVIILFIITARFTSLSIGYILLGYITAMISFWFAPLLVFKKDAKYERNHIT